MKKLGIIGGAGPLASALLYEAIIQECYSKGISNPEMILINYPFTRGLRLHEREANEALLRKELAHCIDQLIHYGVEVAILACNTLHLLLTVKQTNHLSMLSIPKMILDEAYSNSNKKLLVLATETTSKYHLYKDPRHEIHYLPEQYQIDLNQVIDRILAGQCLMEDSNLISKMVCELQKTTQYDALVLACTDLPVLHHKHPIATQLPIYDSIKCPARQIGGLL